jgi:outer membrane protein assembly factor BamD
MNSIKILVSVIILITLTACGATKTPESRTPDQIFQDGVKLFNDEDYLEAKFTLDLIRLQYPASQYADDAQYYLAEISYKKEEFILAAYNYNMLRRVYPGSPYSKECLYKTALSYFGLSPSYDRDQDYTKKAIESFQEFQYLYPDDSLSAESAKKIKELRNKLAHREYFTAELYKKLDSPRSSIIYYDAVINNFNDTEYYELAMAGKIELLIFMKKYDQVQSLINAYKTTFPNSPNNQKFDELLKNKH